MKTNLPRDHGADVGLRTASTPALIGSARHILLASLAAENESTSMLPPPRKTLPGLTIVRFFAALCIVLNHFTIGAARTRSS